MNKIVISLILSILMISLVSAFEFDNVKTYDPIKKEVTLKNSILGIPTSEIARATLISNTESCGGIIECSAVVKVNLYEEYTDFFKKLDITRLDKVTKYNIKEQNVLIKTGTKEIDVPDYDIKCHDIQNPYNKEKEIIYSCQNEQVGSHKEYEDVYEVLTPGMILPTGEYYFKITGKKETYESVEWIANFAGLDIKDWAVWGVTQLKYSFGYGLTVDHDNTAIGAFTYSALNFTATETFALQKIQVYVAEDGGLSSSTFWSLYMQNSTGGINLTQIGVNSSSISDFIVGNAYNFTAVNNDSIVQAGYRYWIVFYASGSGSYIRLGDIAGTPSALVCWSNYLWLVASASTKDCGGNAVKNVSIMLFGATETITPSLVISTNLTSPISSYNSTSSSITFIGNATIKDGNITNMTLYFYNSSTEFKNFTAINGAYDTSTFNVTNWTYNNLNEGSYTWNILSCGTNTSISSCSWAVNRSFTVDINSPVISILSPLNNSNITEYININKTIALNFTARDSASGLASCWYNNETANVSITCNANTTINVSQGYHTIIFYANDSVGFNAVTSARFFYNVQKYTVNYTSVVTENENTTFYFNLTSTEIDTINATLVYNNTLIDMTLLSSNLTEAAFYKTLSLPDVGASQIKQFNFSYYLNGDRFNTTLYNQTINNIAELNVTGGNCTGNVSIRFILKVEDNITDIIGDFDYIFYYGLTNTTSIKSFGSVKNSNNFSLCINASVSPSFTLGYGEIQYRSTNYVERRYYLFSGTNLSTNVNTIYLYDLPTTLQTSFKLEIEDTSLNPYSDKFTTLVRWYPGTNEYNVVDMGKTDEKGSTVIHVKTEDVDYRIGVYEQNGTLIKLADPIRMVCLSTPCTYTLRISPTESDYTSFLNIQYSLNYNYTTGMWNFVYTDNNLKTQSMNLTVYKLGSISDYAVCSSVITGSSGALSCNTSIYSGTLKAEVVRTASPGVILAQKLITTTTTTFKSSWGLFLSLILAIPIMFLLVLVSPVAAIIGGIISLIPALYLGSINIAIFGGIVVLGGIVAHFIKRVG